jgi:serine protease Do
VRLDEPIARQLERQGLDAAIVVGVEPGSPAAAANLLFGDLILSVAGQPIENAIDIKIAMTRIPLGSPVGVQVYRAGAKLDTTVIVRERGRP